MEEKSPKHKQQLIDRIVEISKMMGAEVSPRFYQDLEDDILEGELDILEKLLESEPVHYDNLKK